jgi:hypothetical protein
MKASDLIVGKNGKVSRTAVAFLAWFLFLICIIGYSSYKSTDGKLPDIPQPYVYLTMVFCGTYTARRYLDGKLPAPVVPPPANTP